MKQRVRSEIDIKDTWDLTYIFKDENEFNKNYEEAKSEIKEVVKYKDKLLLFSNSFPLKTLTFFISSLASS